MLLIMCQEFGSIVSETFNIEKTHMQFSHELFPLLVSTSGNENMGFVE